MDIIKVQLILIMLTMTLSATDPTEYGEIIGRNGKTNAYSNKNDVYVSNEFHFINLHNKSLCSGMKWQCVEYARRWLMENRDISFGDVEYATDIWRLSGGIHLFATTKSIVAMHYANSTSVEKPEVGDLLIYDTSYAPTTGHVSVIVGVTADTIKVAEQNYSSYKWTAPDYSQELRITRQSNEEENIHYRVEDTGVIGWVRFLKM